jgi:hypothetical protein
MLGAKGDAVRVSAVVAIALIVGTTTGAAGATVFGGPAGSFSTMITSLEYDPSTACSKPMRPYSEDRDEWNYYIRQGKQYLQCMQDAAESDTKYANEVIAEGLQEKSDDFVSEVKRGY